MSDAERGRMRLPMLTVDAKLTEIKRLYFRTTAQTIQQDIAKALDLLKSMANEEERERAAVYMDGLAQMRSDWARRRKAQGGSGPKAQGSRPRASRDVRGGQGPGLEGKNPGQQAGSKRRK